MMLFRRVLAFLAVLLLSVSSSLGLEVKRYFLTEAAFRSDYVGNGKAQETAVPAWDMSCDPSLPDGSYTVNYTVHRKTSDGDFTQGASMNVVKSGATITRSTAFYVPDTGINLLNEVRFNGLRWTNDDPVSKLYFTLTSVVRVANGTIVEGSVLQSDALQAVAVWPVGASQQLPWTVKLVIGVPPDPCPPRQNVQGDFTVTGTKTYKEHKVALYVDGGLVREDTVPAQNNPEIDNFSLHFEYEFDTVEGSFTWEWKVDGVKEKGGSVDCADENPNISGTYAFPPEKPPVPSKEPPLKDQTQTQTNPDPNPGTQGGKSGDSPGTTLPGGSGVSGGTKTTAEMTKTDFYEAVKAALIDGGNTGTMPGPPLTDGIDDASSERLKRGHLDEVDAELEKAKSRNDQGKSALLAKLDFSHSLDFASMANGSVSALPMGTLHFGAQVHNWSISLTPYSSLLSQIRNLLLFIINVLGTLKCARTLYDAFI